MSSLSQRLLQGAGLSVFKLAAGLVKLKVVATLLGVEGVGVLSLVLQFQGVAVALISMGMALGVINLGRPLWTQDLVREASGVAGTALILILANAAVFLGIFAMGHTFFREIVFSGHLGDAALWPVVAAAIFAAVAGGFWEGFFFLTNRFDLYVKTGMTVAVLDAIAFGVGAWTYGLQGAIAAALVSSASLFVIFSVIGATATLSQPLLAQLHWERKHVAPLLGFCVLMLCTTALGSACLLLARSTVVAGAGIVANGLLQVPVALAAYLMPFITNGVHGHLFPLAAAKGDVPEVRAEFDVTLRASTALTAAGCMGVVLTTPLLVPLVYTTAFAGARPYISLYFIGEFFFITASVYGVYLLAIGSKRAYFLGVAGYHLLLVAGVVTASRSWGAWAYVASHATAAVIIAAVALVYGVRSHQIQVTLAGRIVLLGVLAGGVCSLAFAEQTYSRWPAASWLLGAAVGSYAMLPILLRHWRSRRRQPSPSA